MSGIIQCVFESDFFQYMALRFIQVALFIKSLYLLRFIYFVF